VARTLPRIRQVNAVRAANITHLARRSGTTPAAAVAIIGVLPKERAAHRRDGTVGHAIATPPTVRIHTKAFCLICHLHYYSYLA
jgi:hypothetical protein